MQTIKDKLIIVSDIHIRESNDREYLLLAELINYIDPTNVKYFVLLGDIFDFCFGASQYFRDKFAEIGKLLSELSQRGVSIYYIQGNHEFSLEYIAWKGVNIVTSKQLTLSVEDHSLAFSHGDRISSPWHYHIYLAITRTFLFRWGGLLCPQKWLDQTCLRISSASRNHSSYKKLPHRKILGGLRRWLLSTQCDFGVVGHFHTPYDYKIDRKNPNRVLCMHSWEKPNYLSFNDGEFKRIYLN